MSISSSIPGSYLPLPLLSKYAVISVPRYLFDDSGWFEVAGWLELAGWLDVSDAVLSSGLSPTLLVLLALLCTLEFSSFKLSFLTSSDSLLVDDWILASFTSFIPFRISLDKFLFVTILSIFVWFLLVNEFKFDTVSCFGSCGATISEACTLIPDKKKNPDNVLHPKS